MMRLARLIPTLLLSSLTTFAPSVDARGHAKRATHTAISQRQYRPQHIDSRDLLDICVNLDAIVDLNPLLSTILGHVGLCLCLKDLDVFLDTHNLNILGLDLEGEVRVLLNNLISAQPPCSALPPHAQRVCTYENPCSFQCDIGYTQVGGQCVCAPPNLVCKGQCSSFPNGCPSDPSHVPRSRKKRAGKDLTFAEAQAFCGDKVVCGVPMGSKNAFDCIDVRFAVDSCGGCMYAHPWSAEVAQSARGQDCSSLSTQHALSHRCESGRCIATCADGYSPSGAGCVPAGQTARRSVEVAVKPLLDTKLDLGPELDATVNCLGADLDLESLIPSASCGSDSSTVAPRTADSVEVAVEPLLDAHLDLGPKLDATVNCLGADLGLGSLIPSASCRSDSSTVAPRTESQPSTDSAPVVAIPLSLDLGPELDATVNHLRADLELGSLILSTSSGGDSSTVAPRTESQLSTDSVEVAVEPLLGAHLDLGPGLDATVNCLTAGLDLGSLVQSASCSGASPPSSDSSGTEPSTSGALAPLNSGPDHGTEIDLKPLADATLNLGPGLDDTVNDVAADIGLGGLVHPGTARIHERQKVSIYHLRV